MKFRWRTEFEHPFCLPLPSVAPFFVIKRLGLAGAPELFSNAGMYWWRIFKRERNLPLGVLLARRLVTAVREIKHDAPAPRAIQARGHDRERRAGARVGMTPDWGFSAFERWRSVFGVCSICVRSVFVVKMSGDDGTHRLPPNGHFQGKHLRRDGLRDDGHHRRRRKR